MKIEEIVESYKQIWGRSKKGVVRRYRCTSGPKKGRVVAKASTCSTGTNQRQSANLKKTRRTRATTQTIKRRQTMSRPLTKKVSAMNKSIRPRKRSKK